MARDCLTPRLLNLVTQLQQQRWSISCSKAHACNLTSDHPLGRTCHVFPGGAAYFRPPRRRPATRPGNRWLKAALGTAALGALRKKNSYLHALYRRIAARRGGKRALAAVAHSQLVTIWQVLSTQTPYRDLGGDYFLRRDNPEHRRRRAIDQLQRLGYRVILEPAA